MRTIERSSVFKRDYKREAKGQYRAVLDEVLKPVLVAPVMDQTLDIRYRDHDLSGDWAGYRECHLKPDAGTLRLARLGSHRASCLADGAPFQACMAVRAACTRKPLRLRPWRLA